MALAVFRPPPPVRLPFVSAFPAAFGTASAGQSVTLDPFTQTAAGVVTVSGGQSTTLSSFTQSAAGSVVDPVTLGAGGRNRPDIHRTFFQRFPGYPFGATPFDGISGLQAVTLDPITANQQGQAAQDIDPEAGYTVVPLPIPRQFWQRFPSFPFAALPPGSVTGSQSATVGDFTPSAAGVVTVTGSQSVNIASFVVDQTGFISGVTGASSVTLDNVSALQTGVVNGVVGGSTATLSAITQSAAGSVSGDGSTATPGWFTPAEAARIAASIRRKRIKQAAETEEQAKEVSSDVDPQSDAQTAIREAVRRRFATLSGQDARTRKQTLRTALAEQRIEYRKAYAQAMAEEIAAIERKEEESLIALVAGHLLN